MDLASSEEFAVKELESDRKKFICMKTTMPRGFMFIFILAFGKVGGTVVLITSANESLPFPDTEANFAPRIPGAGILGLIHLADPLNGCLPLVNGPASSKSPFSSFVIIIRGQCTFESKVRNAQNAGYAAAIIYNNEETQELVTMSGDSAGIHIPAVFISKGAGDVLLEYARDSGSRCYILPAFEYTAWSVMAVSFISLLAVTAVLATFFFVRRHQLRHLGSRLLTRESSGMSAREVKALPSLTFRHPLGSVTSETCAICLEDYEPGQKLRVLPCHHEFHVACVDQWLTTRRPFCPVCKRDAHSKSEVPVVSENTPLLASPVSVPIPTPIVTHTSLGRMSLHSLGSFDAPVSNVVSPASRPQILRSHLSYSSPLSSPVAASSVQTPRLNPNCRRVASTPQMPL